MARAYTVSSSKYWDDAAFGGGTARQGADTYNITSGAVLTIDTDTRTCQNSTEGTGCFGTITVDEGQLFIDATAIRILAFDAGNTGVAVPAKGAILYDDSGLAYGECLGVWATLASAPKVHGTDMWPSAGFIKFRSLTGSFADNAQVRTSTGGGGTQVATSNGVDRVGWLEIAGVEASNIVFGGSTSGTLGSFKTRGAWFAVGTTPTTPATTDTYQLPSSYTNTNFGGVWVNGVHWPNAGNIAANTLATDARGRVCWISSSGLLRFGSDGTNTGGELPPANAAITIPNIILLNTNTTVTSGFTVGANATLNSTFATRYDITLGAGVLDLEYLTGGWTMAAGGADFTASHCSFLDTFSVTSTAFGKADLADIIVGYSGVGTPPNNVIDNTSLFGGTWSNVTAVKGAASQVCRFLVATGFNVTNLKLQPLVSRTAVICCLYMDGAQDNIFDGLTLIGAAVYPGGNHNTYKNVVYCDTLIGTVGTANALSIFIGSGGNDTLIDGISWLLATTNTCHPYNYLLSVDRSVNFRLRNAGSAAAPLDCGSVNAMGAIWFAGNTATLLKVDRIYTTDLRLGVNNYNTNASLLKGFLSNLWAGATDTFALTINMNSRGGYGNPDVATRVAGSHFSDGFQSATAGKIVIHSCAPFAEEPSASSVVVTGGTPTFTMYTVYMPVVGDQVTWRVPYKIRGYTAFNGAPTFAAGTFANFLTEYSLDLGVTWKTANSTNLNAEVLPDPAVGFNFWVRVTCITGSTNKTTNGVDRITFAMTTTSGAQANQYALEEITFTDSRSDGVADASIAWVDPAGTTLFGFYIGTGTEVTYQNQDGTEKTGTYISRRAGYGEFVGGWTETTSWYLDTKVYFVAQTLIEATIADSGGITFVGDTSATLGASKTFQQLYSNSQHWSCLEANMLYAIPVVSAGGGAYTANVDVVTTGYTLNGAGSLSMGGYTLTASVPWAYTYTGGTFSQASTVPSFSGGTLSIGTAGTYTYAQAAAMILSMTPTAPGTYALGAVSFTGQVDLRNTSGTHAITVELPSGTSYTTANNTGATITVTAPVVTADISITGMSNTVGANTRLQIINQTAAAAASRANSTAYSAGDVRLRQTGAGSENTAGLYLRCTTSGISDASPPTWNTTVGGTTTDGTVVWTTYAILYYHADPAATSFADTYIDGEEFLAGETVEIRFAEEDPAVSFKTYSTSVIATAAGFSALVSASADSVYATYGLSGAAQDSVFSPNFVANYIVLDANINFAGSSAYAYYCYLLTTDDGMYRFWGGLTGIDPGNIRNNVSVISLYFDETAGFVRQTDDVRIFRSDGARPALDPTTGGAGIEINWKVPVNVVTTGGSALTTDEHNALMGLPSAAVIANEVVNVVTFP